MGMEKLVAVVTSLPKSKTKRDDDAFDRLSSKYTVAILVVFALVVTMQAYVGKPITCWAPKHFTGSHTKYTNSYCWVKNTYYLPWNQPVPRAHEEDKRNYVTYYQWVPFILLGQAIFFYLPSCLWHGLNERAGMDADSILSSANTLRDAKKVERREKIVGLITNQMDRFLSSRKKQIPVPVGLKYIPQLICTPCRRRFGAYLVILFLFSKVLYIINVIGQLFVLNSVLSMRYSVYGAEVLANMVADHDWTEATNVAFPRVTLCDFLVRRLGNVQRYTVQCVLPINLFNEKIYIFLWFWMVLVAVLTCFGFGVWLIRTFFRGDRVKFIYNHLQQRGKADSSNERDQKLVDGFLDDYLRQDGAFLLRLISHNTNNITVTDIMCSMFDAYKADLKITDEDDDKNTEDEDDSTKELFA